MSVRSLPLLLVLALIGAACGSSDPQTTETSEIANETAERTTVPQATETPATDAVGAAMASAAAGDSWDTTAGVTAAQWGDNITITIADGEFRYESDGIPNHELPDQLLVPRTGSFTPPVTEDEVSPVDTSVAVVASPVDQTITTNPVFAGAPTDTSLGIIGVTISGAQLFNDYEDQDRAFVAVDDNFSVDGVFFVDSCNGHPLALLADGTGAGNYHYHGVPYCLTDVIDVEGEHSSILGFLVDGFPFHGPKDAGGATISSDDLDDCSGHVGPTPEFPEGVYHYHITEDRSPYTVDCYQGEVAAAADAGGPGGDRPDGPPPGDDGERPDGPPPGDGEGTAPADAAPADESATAPVEAADADEATIRAAVVTSAQWADNVTIAVDGTTVRFTSDGLPAHEYLDVYLADGRDGKYIAGGVDSYNASFSFPLVPTMSAQPSDTPGGAIGVAISGAVFFDPYEGDGSGTIANDDNETIDGVPFIDACGGHPLPNGRSYHYHGIPFCITDAVDTAGTHSTLIGYLFDGIPIYGPQDVDGEEPTDLDPCLGHFGPTPEFPDGTYHYHVVSTANYISECYSGDA